MDHPLKTYRFAKGLTLAALAVRAGTTPATLSRVEQRKQQPSLALIGRLILASGGVLTADDFLTRSSSAEAAS